MADQYNAAAAEAYECMVEPLTGTFSAALLDAAGVALAGRDVLDVACGSGAVTLCACARGAIVTACDVSPAMVERCAARSSAAATAVANVMALPSHWSGRFDVAVSSFGVIFCGELVAGLKEMARCLRPGGVLIFSAWGSAAETAGYQIIPQAAAACLPLELSQKVNPLKKRSEGSVEKLREALVSAMGEGAADSIRVHGPETRALTVESPAAYWTRFAKTSPGLRALLAELDGASTARLRERVLELVAPYVQTDGSVSLPVSAYFGVARAPSRPSALAPRPLKRVCTDPQEGARAPSPPLVSPPSHVVVVASATEPRPRERRGDNRPEQRRALILGRLHSVGCRIDWVRPDGGAALRQAVGEEGSYMFGRVLTAEKLDFFARLHAHFRSDPSPDAGFLSLETDELDGLVPYFFTRRRAAIGEPMERRLAWHATDSLTPVFTDLVLVLQCDAAVCASAVERLSGHFPEHFPECAGATARRAEDECGSNLPPTVFAVTAHPGHHATPDRYGGYCFLNNAVFIAQLLLERGIQPFIVDVDYHGGDGTADSLADGGDSLDSSPLGGSAAHVAKLMVSLHAPCDYPFLPAGLPWAVEVPPATTWQQYEPLLREALSRRPSQARVIIVSLGFDTLEGDPDAREGHRLALRPSDFGRMRHVFEECGLPVIAVQEGGYHLADIPDAAEAFCTALQETV